jgi:hypothetical protein
VRVSTVFVSFEIRIGSVVDRRAWPRWSGS